MDRAPAGLIDDIPILDEKAFAIRAAYERSGAQRLQFEIDTIRLGPPFFWVPSVDGKRNVGQAFIAKVTKCRPEPNHGRAALGRGLDHFLAGRATQGGL